MISLKQKLNFLQGWEIIANEMPNSTEFEQAVILLRQNNVSYANIQSYLGNPSKKVIRQILLKWKPELIEKEIAQTKKQIKDKPSEIEYRLRPLLEKNLEKSFTWDKDPIVFTIVEGRIYFTWDGDTYKFTDWPMPEQSQIYYDILRQCNV